MMYLKGFLRPEPVFTETAEKALYEELLRMADDLDVVIRWKTSWNLNPIENDFFYSVSNLCDYFFRDRKSKYTPSGTYDPDQNEILIETSGRHEGGDALFYLAHEIRHAQIAATALPTSFLYFCTLIEIWDSLPWWKRRQRIKEDIVGESLPSIEESLWEERDCDLFALKAVLSHDLRVGRVIVAEDYPASETLGYSVHLDLKGLLGEGYKTLSGHDPEVDRAEDEGRDYAAEFEKTPHEEMTRRLYPCGLPETLIPVFDQRLFGIVRGFVE